MSVAALSDLVAALELLPGATVDETVKRFVPIAEEEAARAGFKAIRIGTYGPYPLTAKLRDVEVSAGRAVMMFEGDPLGFWRWAESGTKPHPIRPKRIFAESEKGFYRAAMLGGLDHPMTIEVEHPGITGRGAWTNTEKRVDSEIVAIVDTTAATLDLWAA